MNKENTGLDKTLLEKFAAGGTVEFENYLPRCRSGMRTWELKIRDADRTERNEEICRLYNEFRLSQVFLANLFNISQPAISVIIKSCRQSN